MKRCIATVLLMLSIEALVAGRLSAAVADDDDVDTIRLPSHGLGEEVMAAARKNGGEERPWKCCDVTVCTRSFPPTCRCLDKVKHCASTCKRCEASESDPSLHVCNDRYHGDPGPSCTKDANGNDNNVPSGVARDHQVMAAAANVGKTKGGDKERPWKCCDVTVCTRSFPPTCRCLDKVKHCASTCKRCEASESDPSLHVCNDWYHGDPGPRCTEDADSAIGAGGN